MSEQKQIEEAIQLIENEIAKYVAQETFARMARIRYLKIKADLEKRCWYLQGVRRNPPSSVTRRCLCQKNKEVLINYAAKLRRLRVDLMVIISVLLLIIGGICFLVSLYFIDAHEWGLSTLIFQIGAAILCADLVLAVGLLIYDLDKSCEIKLPDDPTEQ